MTTINPTINPTQTKRSRGVSLQEYQSLIDQVLEKIDLEIAEIQSNKKRVKGVRSLRGIRKKIVELSKKAPKLNKTKRVLKKGAISGFSRQYRLSPELEEFLDFDTGDTASRNEVTRAVCVYINRKPDETRETVKEWFYLNEGENGDPIRDLRDPTDHMRILPDDSLSELLKYEEWRQKVNRGEETTSTKNENGERVSVTLEDDGLYYRTLQKLLSPHFVELIPKE